MRVRVSSGLQEDTCANAMVGTVIRWNNRRCWLVGGTWNPQNGLLVELVTISHCHCEGHGFEPRADRQIGPIVHRLGYLPVTEVRRVRFPLGPPNWPYRLSVRTSGFRPEKEGSTPSGATILGTWCNGSMLNTSHNLTRLSSASNVNFPFTKKM
jgi:hypothetical protein